MAADVTVTSGANVSEAMHYNDVIMSSLASQSPAS